MSEMRYRRRHPSRIDTRDLPDGWSQAQQEWMINFLNSPWDMEEETHLSEAEIVVLNDIRIRRVA